MGNNCTNVLIVGVGGQGIILAGDILSQAALNQGMDVKKSEIHGMSQRGGSVFSHIRFGKKVYSPVMPIGGAHILLSLEEMETLRWLSYAGEDTEVIVLQNRINPAMVENYPEKVDEELQKCCPRLNLISPESLIRDTGDRKYLNVFLLGCLSKHLKMSEEAWKQAVKKEVPPHTFEQNWEAFKAGVNF